MIQCIREYKKSNYSTGQWIDRDVVIINSNNTNDRKKTNSDSKSFRFDKSFIVWLDELALTVHIAHYPVISKIKV